MKGSHLSEYILIFLKYIHRFEIHKLKLTFVHDLLMKELMKDFL